MRLAFYTPGVKRQEIALAEALRAGGIDITILHDAEIRDGFDLHCVVGVKAWRMVRELEERGAKYLYWDKGYNRDWPTWWRFAFCAHQPVRFLERATCSGDRLEVQGWLEQLRPWRPHTDNGHILYAGASGKYNIFHDLGDATAYAELVVEGIRAHTNRPVVYRPKPSWRDAEAVEGAAFSHSKVKRPDHDIYADLNGAHAMVTHGSSACVEAMLAGVPSIILGQAVVRPISSTNLEEVDNPRMVSEYARRQLLANLAYCQLSLDEMRGRGAWRIIKQHLEE